METVIVGYVWLSNVHQRCRNPGVTRRQGNELCVSTPKPVWLRVSALGNGVGLNGRQTYDVTHDWVVCVAPIVVAAAGP